MALFRDRSLLCLINLFPLMPFPVVENPTIVVIQACRYLGREGGWQLPGTHSLRKQEQQQQQQHHLLQIRATTLPELP